MSRRLTINLSAEDRRELEGMCRKDRTTVWQYSRARILLLCDEGPMGPAWPNTQVAEAVGVSTKTVEITKRRMLEKGLKGATQRKPRHRLPPRPIITDVKERPLMRLIHSKPPGGKKRWTISLLAKRMVELGLVEHISPSTVHQWLKKKWVSLGQIIPSSGVIHRVNRLYNTPPLPPPPKRMFGS